MMIHQLLSLTRPLFVLDTETTGTDPRTDRIVELGFQRWTAEGVTKEYRTLVNPGVSIPASATKVHGITDDNMQTCQDCRKHRDDVAPDRCRCDRFRPVPTFQQLAANLAGGFSDCDFAGQHVRFDLRVLDAEMQRAGVAWSYAGARIVDSYRLEALALPRDLGSLHEKYTGARHEGAHGALSDVRASATVIAAQLEVHSALPRVLSKLHDAQWPGWLCDGGQFTMIDGVATCQFGKWRGRPMREIDPSYWDWILRSEFPADVKALASAAKMGEFPK